MRGRRRAALEPGALGAGCTRIAGAAEIATLLGRHEEGAQLRIAGAADQLDAVDQAG